MQQQTIQRILDRYATNLPRGLAGHLYEALAEIRGIQDAVRGVAAKKQALSEDFQAEVKKLNGELAAIREQCPHWSTTFHGDPSGGSDKSNTCDFCGAEPRT